MISLEKTSVKGDAVNRAPASAEVDSTVAPQSDVLGTSHLVTDLKARSIRGGMITVAGQAIQTANGLIGMIVLARLLSPVAYGVVGMVTVVTGFLGVFADMGLSQATIQRKEIAQGDISALFWINTGIGLLLSSLTALIAPVLVWIYHEPKLISVTLWLSPIFLIGSIGAQHGALLRRQMRFGAAVTCDLVAGIAGTLVAVYMAFHHSGYWAIVAQYLVVAITATSLKWLLCSWRPGIPVFNQCVRSMTAFGAQIVSFDSFNYFARNADNFLIGWRWGAWDLGLYSKAYSLLMLPLRQINQPIGAVAIPMLSRLQDQPERYRRAYRSASDLLCMITMPMIVFFIMTADWVVRVALGAQWDEAGRIFRYLGFAALLQPLANSTGWLFVSQARTREYAYWGYFSGILATSSFAAGIAWGPVGVAVAYAVACLVIASPILFHVIGAKGPVSTKDLYQTIIMPACASVCVAAGVGGLRTAWPHMNAKWGVAVSVPLAVLLAIIPYIATSGGRVILKSCMTMLRSVFFAGNRHSGARA